MPRSRGRQVARRLAARTRRHGVDLRAAPGWRRSGRGRNRRAPPAVASEPYRLRACDGAAGAARRAPTSCTTPASAGRSTCSTRRWARIANYRRDMASRTPGERPRERLRPRHWRWLQELRQVERSIRCRDALFVAVSSMVASSMRGALRRAAGAHPARAQRRRHRAAAESRSARRRAGRSAVISTSPTTDAVPVRGAQRAPERTPRPPSR